MNEEYSKENLILEAISGIVVGDNSNTGKVVREMHYYIGDRIFMGYQNQSEDFPQVTMELDDGGTVIGLASSNVFLRLNIWVDRKSSSPNMTVNRIASRLVFLLNKKPVDLNTQVSGKNLKCRSIHHLSTVNGRDDIKDLIQKVLLFQLKVDDEVISC